jgi:cytoskeletal protein CcmA (bactofilin family)
MTFSRNPDLRGQGGDLNPPERPRFLASEPEATSPPQSETRSPLGRLDESTLGRAGRLSATPAEQCTNVVGAGARWKGNLSLPDSVRIEGQFNGDIDAKGTVHISEGAIVEAKIAATFVVIGGNYKGEIRCSERTELLPNAKVLGDVFTKLFTIHEGAIIDGSIHMSADKIAESTSRPSSSSRSSESANGRAARASEEALTTE